MTAATTIKGEKEKGGYVLFSYQKEKNRYWALLMLIERYIIHSSFLFVNEFILIHILSIFSLSTLFFFHPFYSFMGTGASYLDDVSAIAFNFLSSPSPLHIISFFIHILFYGAYLDGFSYMVLSEQSRSSGVLSSPCGMRISNRIISYILSVQVCFFSRKVSFIFIFVP